MHWAAQHQVVKYSILERAPRPIQSISRDIRIFCLSVRSYHWMPSLEITKPTGTLIAAACSGSGKVTISTV